MSSNHLLDTIRSVITPIHAAGYPFIIGFFVVAFLLSQLSTTLGWIGFIISFWCVYFFRNPKRFVPQKEGLILSPADGRVQLIEKVVPPEELEIGDEERVRVSVFLNVFDVHVNRIPAKGMITKKVYHEGKFLNASLDKASEENERQLVAMKLDISDSEGEGKSKSGKKKGDDEEKEIKIGFVQIAGLVARRIVCTVDEGQEVRAGEEYGLIRFGSRVDIFLPVGVDPMVAVGQRCIGGETIIADINNPNASIEVVEM